jgi:photosystem II stability/assembly factor-like uncharacterized protein
MKTSWLLYPAVVVALFAIINTGHAQTLREEHNEGNPEDRLQHFYMTRAYPFGKIPQNARLNALLHAETKMQRYGGGNRGTQGSVKQWQQIGPYDLGGRISSIALHPTDGHTLWAGAADGGVWKSTDRGESWSPVMDNENAIAMGALAVDPTSPEILYAGTGEATDVVDAYGGAGIFKSTDGGITWHTAGLTGVAAFSRIAVHPGNGNIVFAAAIRNNAGFYRSSNSGATWTRILGTPVYDITINPANPDELWIGGGPGSISHSTDGGLTFTASDEGITVDGAFIGRVSVQVAPSSPGTLYALAQAQRFSGAQETRVFKSSNRGAEWFSIYDENILSYYGNPQGGYNNVIAVRPDNPETVIAGGVVLAFSRDGGNGWLVNEALHPDHHAIAFDPTNPDRIYIANDGGMYRSDDAGATFKRISKGLAITQFYAMAIDRSVPDLTYGGTQDNGTVTNSATDYWGTSTGVVHGGDGFVVVVDRETPTVLYHEQPYGRIFRTDLAAGTTVAYTDGLDLSSQGDRATWSAPLVMDPKRPDILYCGRQRVYRRTAQSVWNAISPAFRTPVSAIGISPVDTKIIYAGSGIFAGAGFILLNEGTPLGELKVSTNGGLSWTERSIGTGLPNRAITEIMASPGDACTAYIAYSGFYTGHIFKTTDCGAHWADISRGLPDIPVNALALHPDDERTIYAGTDIGMFITTDGGSTWAVYSNGLPKVAVVDLEVHPSRGLLRAATHGRSMWEIELERPESSPAITIPSGRERWIGRTSHLLAWSGIAGPVRIDYSTDTGRTWQMVADNATASSYEWEVVNEPTTTARIRVASVQDTSVHAVSSTFTIESYRAGGLVAASTKPFGTWGLAFDGKYLWGTIEQGDSLVKFDPNTLATLGSVRLTFAGAKPLFSDITFNAHTGTFFLHDVTDAYSQNIGWLCEVDSAGELLHRWKSPCAFPAGLVWLPGGGDSSGYLLASDQLGDQNFYTIDPDDGSVLDTIPPHQRVEFGPAGLAAAGDGRSFWQVVSEFDPDRGPLGAHAVLRSLESQNAECTFPLDVSPDSASAGGYTQWGRIFARGVERDPRDGNLWVTGIDGSIYEFIPCEATALDVPAGNREAQRYDAHFIDLAPNPSYGDVRLRFALNQQSHVQLSLYDTEGHAVAPPLLDATISAGEHLYTLNPHELASGVYLCHLAVGGHSVDIRTVILIH